MREKTLTIEHVLTLLAEAPRRIAAVTAGLELARLHAAPNDHEWSGNDVLAHLRACADVWGGSIETMVREDHPTMRAISPRTWIHDTDYPESAFGPSFDVYGRQRAELLVLLKRLSPEEWARGGLLLVRAGFSSGLCSRKPRLSRSMNGRTSSKSSASWT